MGMAIKGREFDLAPYNALNPDFGYPMTVCTNLWNALQMRPSRSLALPHRHGARVEGRRAAVPLQEERRGGLGRLPGAGKRKRHQ